MKRFRAEKLLNKKTLELDWKKGTRSNRMNKVLKVENQHDIKFYKKRVEITDMMHQGIIRMEPREEAKLNEC